MSILHEMLFLILSASAINSVIGNGLHKLTYTEIMRPKRHGYNWGWGHDEFPTFVHDRPGSWGSDNLAPYNQYHPTDWGRNDYSSYEQYHPTDWARNDYTSHKQQWGNEDYTSFNPHPPILKSEDFTKYTDYHGGWGSFDIVRSNGMLTDRQQFPDIPSDNEPLVNQNNPNVLQKETSTAGGRRISELICDELLRNRTAREDNYNRIEQHTYVVGGRTAETGEFPHMGAVGWKAVKGTWIFICGSSLISNKFLLTAGHCSKVSSRYPNVANTRPEIVRIGSRSIADKVTGTLGSYDIKIQRIINHPQYAPPKKYFDIAIIELVNAVFFDKAVHPACLWTNPDTSPLGSKATVTGWGVVETATLKTIPDLQAADVDILNSNVCDNLLRPLCTRLWCGMTDSQLCAGILRGGIDACQGDSGGPLQVRIDSAHEREGAIHYLVGITSFGNGCAQANAPAVYTRISSFIDWIENVVWGSTT